MNSGKIFELEFKDSIPADCYYHRIKDSNNFNFDNPIARFTSKNPFDVLLFYNKTLFTLELKSKKTKSITIQKDKTEKGKDIKIHQINGLLESSIFNGIKSGFIFNFRLIENLCYFVEINSFMKFMNDSAKKSINLDEVNKIGIKIESQKKRVRYKYNLIDFLCSP